MVMRRWLVLGVACGAMALGTATPAQEKDATRTGWISDQACKAQHMGGGGAGCVQKCWRGGEAVGHPEWKPQKAVFVADEDRAVWVVENPEAVKDFPAVHVQVTGKFDAEKKTIHVEKVTAAQ
jgi:hypothetical protein